MGLPAFFCLFLPVSPLLPLTSIKNEKKKNTQRNLTQRFFFFPPPRPPSKFFVFAFFLDFKEETQPEHKEFRRLKAPKKGEFGHGTLGEIFVFGCLFSALIVTPDETKTCKTLYRRHQMTIILSDNNSRILTAP